MLLEKFREKGLVSLKWISCLHKDCHHNIFTFNFFHSFLLGGAHIWNVKRNYILHLFLHLLFMYPIFSSAFCFHLYISTNFFIFFFSCTSIFFSIFIYCISAFLFSYFPYLLYFLYLLNCMCMAFSFNLWYQSEYN